MASSGTSSASNYPWSNAFSAASAIPSYASAFGKKGPTFKGIDFTTGKTVDLGLWNLPSSAPVATPPESSVPSLDPGRQAEINAIYGARLGEIRTAADIANESTLKQMRGLYPYLSAAGQQATERALSASQRYRAFVESLPTSISNLATAAQGRMQSAQSGEAALLGAVSDAAYKAAMANAQGLQIGTRLGRA